MFPIQTYEFPIILQEFLQIFILANGQKKAIPNQARGLPKNPNYLV